MRTCARFTFDATDSCLLTALVGVYSTCDGTPLCSFSNRKLVFSSLEVVLICAQSTVTWLLQTFYCRNTYQAYCSGTRVELAGKWNLGDLRVQDQIPVMCRDVWCSNAIISASSKHRQSQATFSTNSSCIECGRISNWRLPISAKPGGNEIINLSSSTRPSLVLNLVCMRAEI